jgi:ABC-2 type transport system ATP-binding protein
MSHSGKLKIKVSSKEEEAVKVLLEIPEIKGVSSAAGMIDVDVIGQDDTYAYILRMLVEKGIPVISYQPQESSLESVFMQLTEGGNGNDN